jgi:hypothetical protein
MAGRIEDLWKWELERRLAVRRWHHEDAHVASEEAWAEASRAPVREARRVQLARAREAEVMKSIEVGPALERERLERIEREEEEKWWSCASRWEDEDQVRTLRREKIEEERAVEIERWIEENAWELFALNAPQEAVRLVLQ